MFNIMPIVSHLNQMVDILNGNAEEPPEIKYIQTELKEILKIVTGPYTLSEHMYLDKHIYIFGERHNFKSDCDENSISIGDFISNTILQNLDKPIDIFLELGYLSGVSCKSDGDLCEIRDKLMPSENLRMHYSDMRIVQKDISTFSILISGLYYNLTMLRNNDNLRGPTLTLLNELRRVLESAHEEDLLDFLIFQSDVKGNLYKQLNNCPVAEELLDFLNDRMIREGFTKKSLLSSIDLVFETGNFEQLAVDLILWESFILDVYILSKMFQDSKNIISYVGNLHAIRQREFITNLGFKLINQYENSEDWVEVSSFKQPFFYLKKHFHVLHEN